MDDAFPPGRPLARAEADRPGCRSRNPAVSVVIPAYNAADFLGKAVDSVLNQTFKDYEVILVENGSSDGSKEWIEKHK